MKAEHIYVNCYPTQASVHAFSENATKEIFTCFKDIPQSLHQVLSFDSPQANNMSKSKTKRTSQHKFSNSEI